MSTSIYAAAYKPQMPKSTQEPNFLPINQPIAIATITTPSSIKGSLSICKFQCFFPLPLASNSLPSGTQTKSEHSKIDFFSIEYHRQNAWHTSRNVLKTAMKNKKLSRNNKNHKKLSRNNKHPNLHLQSEQAKTHRKRSLPLGRTPRDESNPIQSGQTGGAESKWERERERGD